MSIDDLVRRWTWSKPLRCRIGWHRWEPCWTAEGRQQEWCSECGRVR